MKRKFTLLFVLALLFSTQYNAQGILNEVKADSLNKYVKELSGDKTFRINEIQYLIKTRNTIYPSSDINTAAMYIKSKFEYFGLTAYEQPFTFSTGGTTYNAKNVYAVQTGTQYPEKKYIICAHYDSMPQNGGIAPGADDNASGSAAVIEAARVISKYSTQYTIVYALWSGEEYGLFGSKYYANKAKADNEEILGVINLDMIAWDFTGNNIVEIEYNILKDGKQPMMDNLLNVLTTANQTYGLNMTLSKFSNASGGSDHYPFLQNNFPAFLMIEDWGNHNTNYHKTTDIFANLYLTYFEKCTKLAISTLAELARTTNALGTESTEPIPTDFALNQNYPNPFNPSTVISYHLANAGYVKLKIYDSIGREVKTLVDEYQSAGQHNAQFSVTDKTLTSGVYFYSLQAGGLFQTKKMVYLK